MLSDKVRIEFSELGVTLEIGFGSPDHSRSVKLTPGEARELCDAISGVKEDDAEWTLANAEAELTNAVYQATAIFEKLERAGKIVGNGHHIRQKIAQQVVANLNDRWMGVVDAEAKAALEDANGACQRLATK